MLIRSQDRKAFVPLGIISVESLASGEDFVDAFLEEKPYESKFAIFSDFRGLKISLGEYESEARCLEILDEIQNEYRYCNHYSGSGINSSDCQSWFYGVYEMPGR